MEFMEQDKSDKIARKIGSCLNFIMDSVMYTVILQWTETIFRQVSETLNCIYVNPFFFFKCIFQKCFHICPQLNTAQTIVLLLSTMLSKHC